MKPITLFTIVLTATVLMASFYMINASKVQSVPEALACNVSEQNDIVLSGVATASKLSNY